MNFLRNTRGAAAIEMALVFPLMVFMYFGLVDLTGLVSLNRKVTYASDVMADLVTRSNTSILKTEIDDYYNAINMVMAPRAISSVRVEVFGFRIAGANISQIWSTNNGQGVSCGLAPSTGSMAGLMTVSNDLVVTRVCTTYAPYVASFLGTKLLGATTFTVKKVVSRRPRASLQLTCYQTTVAAGTVCS